MLFSYPQVDVRHNSSIILCWAFVQLILSQGRLQIFCLIFFRVSKWVSNYKVIQIQHFHLHSDPHFIDTGKAALFCLFSPTGCNSALARTKLVYSMAEFSWTFQWTFPFFSLWEKKTILKQNDFEINHSLQQHFHFYPKMYCAFGYISKYNEQRESCSIKIIIFSTVMPTRAKKVWARGTNVLHK